MKCKRLIQLFCFFLLCLCLFSCQNETVQIFESIELKDGWKVVSSEDLSETGDIISTIQQNTGDWYKSSVPTTVLNVLVENGKYQKPYFGNNLASIPTDQFKKSWWFRKEFEINSSQKFENAKILFEGINYRANIWLNGQQVAQEQNIFGSFRIFDFDISRYIIEGVNVLAVEIIPPKPGDPTIGFVDWNPTPPDKNMGIWRGVKLKLFGKVFFNETYVTGKINTETYENAKLKISTKLSNYSNSEVQGILKGSIGSISFQKLIKLEKKESKIIILNSDEFSQLNIQNPKLWWPINYGKPNLHNLTLEFIEDGNVSCEESIRFGIREVTDYLNEDGHRGYKINGKKILIKGGGWVDDLMLADDYKKVEAQVLYTKHMNLNTIRLEGYWGNSQDIYNLCDEHGILLMPGWSCHWEWENYLGKAVDNKYGGIISEDDIELVSDYTNDQIIWLRNHPSIFMWGFGSDMLPAPELEKNYHDILKSVDPTRPFLVSHQSLNSSISGPSGVKMFGPYDYVPPVYWYIDTKHGGAYGFNTETGPGPQVPLMESIKKMIPEENLWPIDEMWNYHCGRNEFNDMEVYINALDHRYGKSTDLNDFVNKGQLMNYEAIRAMFEAFEVNKYKTTGIIQWMLNSAWPETFWQLYDYYLLPTSAFYGTKTAVAPMNLIYNYGDNAIYSVNNTLKTLHNFQAIVSIYNFSSEKIYEKKVNIDLKKNFSDKILSIPEIKNKSNIYFIDLKLLDNKNELIENNFYWLSKKQDVLDFDNSKWFYTPQLEYADFVELKNLPKTEINVEYDLEKNQDKYLLHVVLKNQSDKISFFNYLNLIDPETGETVKPLFWDDNFVTILPGETKKICCEFFKENLIAKEPVFEITGWNLIR